MRPQKKRLKPRLQKRRDCYYCKQKVTPDYKDIETLRHVLSERGKIIPKGYTGVCQKHQSAVGTEVKRARFLALLPYIIRPS